MPWRPTLPMPVGTGLRATVGRKGAMRCTGSRFEELVWACSRKIAMTCQAGCSEQAEVIFNYNISQGRQRVALCTEHAREWQKTYNATEAGLSLSIEPLST